MNPHHGAPKPPRVPVLELVAGALLNRCPAQYGHLLLLTDAAASLSSLPGEVQSGLRLGLRQCSEFAVTETTLVKDLASWMYSVDLGQGAGARPAIEEEDLVGEGPTDASDAVHYKRRLAFIHNLHKASADVQAFLVGALQLNALYGSGERSLRLVTIVATASAPDLALVSQRLRERFCAAALLANGHTPFYNAPIREEVHALLAEDPGKTTPAIFGVPNEVYPPSGVYVSTDVHKYLLACLSACRMSPACGVVVPSHSLVPQFLQVLKVYAKVSCGRDFATPADVRRLFPHLIFHRVHLQPQLAVSDGHGKLACELAVPHLPRHGSVKDRPPLAGAAGKDFHVRLVPPAAGAVGGLANEDILHGVLATVYTTSGPVSHEFNAHAAEHNWAFVCDTVKMLKVPL